MLDKRQGIEHVVATEQGFVLPGMVIAAGDSHTTTHGAMGALGFGIGSSEIEHLLATQTLVYNGCATMRVTVRGRLGAGVTAKDLVMALIRRIGADGAGGHVIEYTGAAIAALERRRPADVVQHECRSGRARRHRRARRPLFEYLHGRPRVPAGAAGTRRSRPGATCAATTARCSSRIRLDARAIAPMVTWGTSPDQGATDRRGGAGSGAGTRRSRAAAT